MIDNIPVREEGAARNRALLSEPRGPLAFYEAAVENDRYDNLKGAKMEIKSGLKTSEYILVVAILAVTNVFAAISPSLAEKFPDNQTLQALLPLISIGLAALVNTFVGLGYVIMRTSLKKANGGFVRLSGMIILAAVLLGALTLGSGCKVNEDWVVASDLTYKAIAPGYLTYLEADAAMDPTQKDAKKLVVQSWAARIEEWKKTLDLK